MNKAGSLIKYLQNYWFVILLLLLGLHITVFQLIGYDLKNIIGDLGDSRFIISIVEYNYQWLSGNYENYWDGFFMYPDKEVISYSDNLLGITPLYGLFRVMGFDFLTSFQLLMIACHILNFVFCFYCFNKFTGNKYAAASGAFIFAFSIALNGVHNHPQYIFRFCIPLFFYFFTTYLNTYNLKNLLYSVFFLILQFYLVIYLGYFLLITAGLFFLIYFLFTSPDIQKLKKLAVHSIPAILVFGLCLFPVFYFYYKRNQITGYYTDYDFYMQTIPRLSSYLKSFPGAISWSFLNNTPVNSKYEWVHILFPGIIVFTSLFFSVYLAFKKQKLYAIILFVLFVFILFTINYNGHTLYGYLMKIPGIKAARVVSRVVIVLIFFGAWLLCLNVKYILENFNAAKKIIIFLLPLLLFFDNYCRPSGFKTFNKSECMNRINKIEQKITGISNYKSYAAFAYIPGTKKDSYIYHIDAMLCALKLKIKTVNGYSSSAHKAYGTFWRDIDSTSLIGWAKAMNLAMDSVLIMK